MKLSRAVLRLLAGVCLSTAFAHAQKAECTPHKEHHKTDNNTRTGFGCTADQAKVAVADGLTKAGSGERATNCDECVGCPRGEKCSTTIPPDDWAKLDKNIAVQPILTMDEDWRKKCGSTTIFKATLKPTEPPTPYDTECICVGKPPK